MLSPADEASYAPLAAELRAFAATLDAPLAALCHPFLDRLLAGEFARMVALMPLWLSDLLPVTTNCAARLGVAQLFGWWYAAARDSALDHATPPATTLGGGLALLRALSIYAELGAADLALLTRLEARAAAAYARELASRPGTGPITAEHIGPWRHQLVTDRAIGLQFAIAMQMDLAGLAPSDPRRTAVSSAIDALIIARQIGDDAGDWNEDLRAGQLNLVTAELARYLLAERPGMSLSAEQMAGCQLEAEAFWEQLWATHRQICAQGVAALVPVGSSRLATLLTNEAERGARYAVASARWRMGVRQIFAV
jgi:hypothetical protein